MEGREKKFFKLASVKRRAKLFARLHAYDRHNPFIFEREYINEEDTCKTHIGMR